MKPLKAYANVLKLRIALRANSEHVKHFPISAYMEPTLICNLGCPACPTGLNLGLRTKATMPVALFRSAIDEMGDYLFHMMMYNWGEPLLHKQTPEMISYAKSKDISVTLSTNLSIKLSDDYIDR